MSSHDDLPSGCEVANDADGLLSSAARLSEGHAALNDARRAFRSVLTLESDDEPPADTTGTPAFFRDLNLDQVVASITAGKQEYNLAPFFYRPLKTVEAVEYRQNVMRDLMDPRRLEAVEAFANDMRTVRERMAQLEKLHYDLQKQAWALDAIQVYCGAAQRLLAALLASPPARTACRHSSNIWTPTSTTPDFRRMLADVDALRSRLASIRYRLTIGLGFVTVSTYRGEADYGAEIQADFEKFRQGAAADHAFTFNSSRS